MPFPIIAYFDLDFDSFVLPFFLHLGAFLLQF